MRHRGEIGYREWPPYDDFFDDEAEEGVCQQCGEYADECPECGEYSCLGCGISDCRCHDEDE